MDRRRSIRLSELATKAVDVQTAPVIRRAYRKNVELHNFGYYGHCVAAHSV